MRKIVVLLAGVAVSVATFLVVRAVIRHSAGTPEDGIEVRFTNLPKIVASPHRVLEKLTEDYAPKVSGGIDDMTVPAPGFLRQLQGVAKVELLLAPKVPAKRLAQLQDWQFVPRDNYVAEVRSLSSEPLTKTEVDLRWQEFLIQVELVQLEQTAQPQKGEADENDPSRATSPLAARCKVLAGQGQTAGLSELANVFPQT